MLVFLVVSWSQGHRGGLGQCTMASDPILPDSCMLGRRLLRRRHYVRSKSVQNRFDVQATMGSAWNAFFSFGLLLVWGPKCPRRCTVAPLFFRRSIQRIIRKRPHARGKDTGLRRMLEAK